jgi:Domain of unknown function (DUF4288)
MDTSAYVAQIIYRIECDGMPTDQYEEQWRLIEVGEHQKPLQVAPAVGKEEEQTFIDRHGRNIHWRLLAVKDIQPVVLRHGALLFSMIREVDIIPAPLWQE